MANQLSERDLEALQRYRDEIKEWSDRKPQQLTGDEWDAIFSEIKAEGGKIPEKYKTRVGVMDTRVHVDYENGSRHYYPEGKIINGYYDLLYSKWDQEGSDITAKYSAIIAKALSIALEREEQGKAVRVDEIIDTILSKPPQSSSLLIQKFLPMLNDATTNDLMPINKRALSLDNFTHRATFTKNGNTITIRDLDDFVRVLGVGGKKLFDTGLLHLTAQNYYRGERVNPSVTIHLTEYWRAQGYEVDMRPTSTEEELRAERDRVDNLRKFLKGKLKEDLDNLKCMGWEGHGTGREKGTFAKYSYVSSYRVRGDVAVITFDFEISKHLISQGYLMQYPTALLLHDNRDPNGYVIGRKLALQHSFDSNASRGTDCTLSVRSLLEEAPEIVSYEELLSKGRRDWKKQIKEKLEQALNKNMSPAPLLSRWEYRNPATGESYTPETASSLSWDEYYSLMVDFTMTEEPDQAPRRLARAEEKAAKAKEKADRAAKAEALALAKAAKAEAPKRKRGRPRKEKKEG